MAHIGNYCATDQVGLEAAFRVAESARKRLEQTPSSFLQELLDEYIRHNATPKDYEAARP